jgi:acyl carrier protein
MSIAITILAEALRIPVISVGQDASMKTLKQWDSLAHMELIALIEERMSITLTFDEIVQMVSVSGIEQVLAQRGIEQ